jgi:RNA polymerase sigma factor (sigma-70 family)
MVGNDSTTLRPLTESTQPDGSTRSLLRRGRLGDDMALNRLFGRVVLRLRRWAHGRLPSGARGSLETADVVQDAAAGVWRRLDGLRLERSGDLEAYIREAVRNRIHDESRRLARRPLSVPLDADIADPSPLPVDCVLRQQVFAGRQHLFCQLRPEEREILIARFEFGYSFDEIAILMSKPSAAAARMALNRILDRLRDVPAAGRQAGAAPSGQEC